MNREEVDAKLAAAEARVDARLSNLEMTVKTGFAEVRSRFAEVGSGFAEVRTGFAELRTEIERVRVEMHKEIGKLIKWAVALSFAVVGTTVGLLHFVSKAS